MNIKVGCSGWSYSDWVGAFYPKESRPQDFLGFYSQVFDSVEIDSTFYRAPSATMVHHWYNSTPAGFVFAPKLPKRITHDQHLENVTSYMEHFVTTLGQLQEKLGPFVVQLPPSFKYPKHQKQFTEFIANLDPEHRYGVEFRHKSWFIPEVQRVLESKNVCQVWSVNRYLATPPAVSADFVYLRLVGDRSISEFKKVQRDQTEVMKTWSKALQDVGESVRDRFVFFNNHFAGFGPASVNEFRRLMGLVELDWSRLKEGGVPQRTLFDFSQPQ
jgi:uncharacterized protein YecE (DUF72 family)